MQCGTEYDRKSGTERVRDILVVELALYITFFVLIFEAVEHFPECWLNIEGVKSAYRSGSKQQVNEW